MRRFAILIGLVITACGGTASGPAWPKSAARETDGGESLAPKPGSVVVSAADDDDDIVVAVPEKPAAKATVSEDKPETPRPVSPTVTAPDDIINTDDLIIEIDD